MAKVETERFFGKKGIIIMIRDGNKMVSAIFKDKKNADKFNRNNPADVKKLLQLAKKTKFPKGIDEDTDVGHQDDEPNMLKSTALEIMEYGKKLMDKLDKYDDMEGEVDFPNWWQSKLTLARDYVSKAYHYLDSEEKTSENIDRTFRTYADDEGDDEGPVDEAYLVAYAKGPKPVKPAFAAYADKKMAQKFMADMKKDGYRVMMAKKKIRGIDEGKKRYNVMYGVGSSKYTVNFHDGKSKHKDGSDFFDIAIFKNKRDLAKKINDLTKKGYIYSYKEGVNEDDMVFDPKTKSFKIKSGSMDWEKNFKWANDKELKVISKFIFMNPKGISGVIKMSKHKPFAFRRTIQKMAKKGLHEGYGPFIKAKNLNDIIKLSKQKKNATFYVTDDNNSRIGTFYLKNGKFAKATTANPNYDFQRNKTNLKDRSDVIYKYKVDESVNEASKEAMGIAAFTGTRGVFVDDFIKKHNIDARKLFNFVKKGNLRDRMDFVTAVAGKPNNKFFKMIVGRFSESVREDKSQITKIKKQAGKKEIKFYDILSKLEKKMGKKKYRDFLVKSLKDFKINGNHYDYRTNAAAEEKLFQLAK